MVGDGIARNQYDHHHGLLICRTCAFKMVNWINNMLNIQMDKVGTAMLLGNMASSALQLCSG